MNLEYYHLTSIFVIAMCLTLLLTMVQTLRLFGAGFLVEASLGIIPTTFGILDGVTHITAAFYALFAAILFKEPLGHPSYHFYISSIWSD